MTTIFVGPRTVAWTTGSIIFLQKAFWNLFTDGTRVLNLGDMLKNKTLTFDMMTVNMSYV